MAHALVRFAAACCRRGLGRHHTRLSASYTSRHLISCPVFTTSRTGASLRILRPCQKAHYSNTCENLRPADLPQETPANIGIQQPEQNLKAPYASEPFDGIGNEINSEFLKPDAPWGLVVYRTCYNDGAAWQKMRACIEGQVRNTLELRKQESLLARHEAVFMEDRSRFEGATPGEVRAHFEQWAREELERNWAEQPVTEKMRAEMFGPSSAAREGLDLFAGTRYNVFALVDDVCLESLARQRPGPLFMLVKKQWDPTLGSSKDEVHPDMEEGWMIDPDEGPNGWIYVTVCEYVHHYDALNDCNEWWEDHRFMYPSLVYGSMCLERSPGFWRQERSPAGKEDEC